MSDFNPSPYRGDANIGHVSEELFKMYFVGSNVSFYIDAVVLRLLDAYALTLARPCIVFRSLQLALAIGMLPGRVLGSEIRPRKYK